MVDRIKLYIVVVLYNRSIGESVTCTGLLKQGSKRGRNIVLVYDNSVISRITAGPLDWNVKLDPQNGGLSSAYNFAANQARALGCQWMLLLDQDTSLPQNDYLDRIHDKLEEMRMHPQVVAVVPIMNAGARQISPLYPRLGREIAYDRRNLITSEWLMGINSGTCVKVDFIHEIGGFNNNFPLDYLDFWLFKLINDKKKSVYVNDITLQHDLSVANMNQVSVSRYKRILAAELRFTNGYLPIVWRMVVVPRLLIRAVKHFVHTRDKRIALSMVRAAMAQIGYLFGMRRPDRTTNLR